MTERTGQCLCGAVRFKLAADPLVTRICWCRDCQHLAANGTVNMLVPADSGNAVTRQFCPTCGTHLFAKVSARPQFRVVRAGNLDDPSSIKPALNIWSSRAPAWACLDPTLEQVDKQPSPPPQPQVAS